MSLVEDIRPMPSGERPAVALLDFVCVSVRIPKCGSESLSRLLREGFAGRQVFYLPSTIKLDGSISGFQNLRFYRTRARNLMSRYGTPNIRKVYAQISARAVPGDLIDGGHIDFPTAHANVCRPLKMITIFRHPVDRVCSDYQYARAGHFRKNVLSRLDATLTAKMAARYAFDGYLDFLLDHGETYGNIASRCIGWDGAADLPSYFFRHVFHSGVLEESEHYARTLSEKLGRRLHFPHVNKSGRNEAAPPTAAQRAKIEHLHEHDMQLYEWQRAHL